MAKLNVYCVEWCPDCKKTFSFLEDNNIPYEYHNIEKLSGESLQKVKDAHDGNDWVTPTFEADGTWKAFIHVDKQKLPNILKNLNVI